jgi:hypothetical protein
MCPHPPATDDHMDVVSTIDDSSLPPMIGDRGDPEPSLRYKFLVRGHLGETLLGAFPALQAETSGGDTLLKGALPDQAALHGVLAEIEALGLELLEVRRLPRDHGD